MEWKLLIIAGGALAGFLVGHIFAAFFDIRSSYDPNVPNQAVTFGGAIVGAIAGGVFVVYF